MPNIQSAADYGLELCRLLKEYGIIERFGELSTPDTRENVARFFVKLKERRKFPVLVVERAEFDNFVEFRVTMPEELRNKVYQSMDAKDAVKFNVKNVVLK